MHIYIDESGVFAPANHPNAWCVVVAYVAIEKDLRSLKKLLTQLKLRCGGTYKDELKLKDLNENQYISFLKSIQKFKGTLYCTATDMSLVTESTMIQHRNIQAEKVIEHKEKMIHESARNGIEELSSQIKGLSPQLYMQLMCQAYLLSDVVDRAILYYVQREPMSLRQFKWRVDQKNSEKTIYEDAFTKVAPAFLQSISLKRPFIAVREFDYSAMRDFIYTSEDAPDYLSKYYGIDVDTTGSFKAGKILGDDFTFNDSKENFGIQIADLLASGIRRALRGKFNKNAEIAAYIGGLMVQAAKGKMPINLISFVDGRVSNKSTTHVINNLRKFSKPMLL